MPGIKEYKVTYSSPEVRHIYVRADSEEGALSIAQGLPVSDWTDDTDERGLSPFEVELDE